MGRRGRSRLRAGPGGGEFDALSKDLSRAIAAITEPLLAVPDAVSGAVDAFAGVGKKLGGEEFDRALGAFNNLTSQIAASSTEALANAISPTLGGVASYARTAAGNVAAAGATGSELQELAASSAFMGMPVGEDLLKEMAPLMLERQRSVSAARRQAANATRGMVGNASLEEGGSAVSWGLGLDKVLGEDLGQKLGEVIAKAFVDYVASHLPIFGGGR